MTLLEDRLRSELSDRAAVATRSFELSDVVNATVVPLAPVVERRRRYAKPLAALAVAAAAIAVAIGIAVSRDDAIEVGNNPTSTSASVTTTATSTSTTEPSTSAPTEPNGLVWFDLDSLPAGWSLGSATVAPDGRAAFGESFGDPHVIAATALDGSSTIRVTAMFDPVIAFVSADRQPTNAIVQGHPAVVDVNREINSVSWFDGDVSVSVAITTKAQLTERDVVAIADGVAVRQSRPYVSLDAMPAYRVTYAGLDADNLPSYEMTLAHEVLTNAQDDEFTISVIDGRAPQAGYVPPVSRVEESGGRRFEITEDTGVQVGIPGQLVSVRSVRWHAGNSLVIMQGTASTSSMLQVATALRLTDAATFRRQADTKVFPSRGGPKLDLTQPGSVRVRGEVDDVRWHLASAAPDDAGRYGCVYVATTFGFSPCQPSLSTNDALPFLSGPRYRPPNFEPAAVSVLGLVRGDVARIEVRPGDGNAVSVSPTAPVQGAVRGFGAVLHPTRKLGSLRVTLFGSDGRAIGQPVVLATDQIDADIDAQDQPASVDLSGLPVAWGPVQQEGTVDGASWKVHAPVQVGDRWCATVEFGGVGGYTGGGPDFCEWDMGNFGDPPSPAAGIVFADLVETRRRFVGVVVTPDITTVRFELTSGIVDVPVPVPSGPLRLVVTAVPKSSTLTAVTALKADGSITGRMATNVGGESTQEYILPTKYTTWNLPTCLSANAPIAAIAQAAGEKVNICPR